MTSEVLRSESHVKILETNPTLIKWKANESKRMFLLISKRKKEKFFDGFLPSRKNLNYVSTTDTTQ